MDWGFHDSFRVLFPEVEQKYSWFDYRSRGFDDNRRGLRIDVILGTIPMRDSPCRLRH